MWVTFISLHVDHSKLLLSGVKGCPGGPCWKKVFFHSDVMDNGLFHSSDFFFPHHFLRSTRYRSLLKESQKCVVTRMLRSVSVGVLKMGLFIFTICSCDSAALNRQRRELKPLLKHSWIQINLCFDVFRLPFVVLKSLDRSVKWPGRGDDADCFKYFSDKVTGSQIICADCCNKKKTDPRL